MGTKILITSMTSREIIGAILIALEVCNFVFILRINQSSSIKQALYYFLKAKLFVFNRS